jgi:hypothetical protein
MKKLALTVIFALLPVALMASTATVVPTSDTTTDTWTTTPLFSKVAEDIDSHDGTAIVSPNNPVATTNDIVFGVTCPADTGTVTAANLRIYIGETNGGGRTTTGSFTWSATAATNISVADLTGGMAERASGNQTGLSISKATCDASTVTISVNTTGTGKANIISADTVNIDITYTPSAARRRLVVTELRRIHPERQSKFGGLTWLKEFLQFPQY